MCTILVWVQELSFRIADLKDWVVIVKVIERITDGAYEKDSLSKV